MKRSISFRNMIVGSILLLVLIFHIKSVSLDVAARFSFRSSRRPTYGKDVNNVLVRIEESRTALAIFSTRFVYYSFTYSISTSDSYITDSRIIVFFFRNMIVGTLLLVFILQIKSVSLDMFVAFSVRSGRRPTNGSPPALLLDAKSSCSFSYGQTTSNLPTSPPTPCKVPPQVFINFRGEQVRYNIVSHLTDALERHEINFFIDENEQRGMNLEHLLVRIEESSIALAIISTRYPESNWCMDELVKMMKLAKKKKLIVIPIFYKVKVGDVGKPTSDDSEFGRNFLKLAEASSRGKNKIKEWKKALESIAKTTGVKIRENSSESDSIKEIIEAIKKAIVLVEEKKQCWVKKLRRKMGISVKEQCHA